MYAPLRSPLLPHSRHDGNANRSRIKQAEAAAAQKAAENARTSQRGAPGGRPPPGGRGDSRNFSYTQQAPNQVGMDELRRLRAPSNRPSSQNVSFGPTSMFNSRSNSGRRLAPGGAFGRAGEDSGASSRTGTPPTRERDSVAHTNAFGYVTAAGLALSLPQVSRHSIC